MTTYMSTEEFSELISKLDPFTQLDIANEITRRLNIFCPNLTPNDALARISEDYDTAGQDPEKLALEFFATSQWEKASEDAEETFWDDCGIEILNSPLHEWLKERGIHHKNADHEEPATCEHKNVTWVFDPETPGAWTWLNPYDAICNDCKAELAVPERDE